MPFSTRFAMLAMSAAIVVSTTSATDYSACYADGERAIGADGYPAVPYLPCCSGKPPLPMDTSAYGYDSAKSWGLFCGGTGKVVVGEECYKDGERAIGAPGYDAVKYMPCCNGMQPKTVAYDWGKFCGGTAPEPVEDKDGPTRCAGEEGYPYVDYVDCGYGFKCEKMPEYSWGFFCVPISKSDCYGPGERAIGSEGYPAITYMPCCDGSEPTPMAYEWGYFCPPAYTGPVMTYAPPKSKTCVKAGMKCDPYASKCCDYTECTASDYGYNTCEAPLMPTPAPMCVLAGDVCDPYGMKCCGPAECNSSGYSNICVAVTTDAPSTTTTTVMPSPDDY